MRTYKILIFISAILALFKNENWAPFFVIGIIAGFIDYVYSDNNTESKKDNESNKGGGAMGW